MTPPSPKRYYRKPDPTECMTVGCTRKALYRNVGSSRGYCRKCRDRAFMDPKVTAARAEFVAGREERAERGSR